MPQYRLTRKFAADMNITYMHMPEITTSALDDWVFDVICIHRKKVAVITHTKTFFTFCLPYSFVGGAKNIIKWMPIFIEDFLLTNDYYQHIDTMNIRRKTPVFCKTNNPQVTGSMNNFKRYLTSRIGKQSIDNLDWDQLITEVNKVPIKSMGYRSPIEMMNELLKRSPAEGLH